MSASKLNRDELRNAEIALHLNAMEEAWDAYHDAKIKTQADHSDEAHEAMQQCLADYNAYLEDAPTDACDAWKKKKQVLFSCTLCHQVPCFLDQVNPDLNKSKDLRFCLMDQGLMLRDSGSDNRQIRFQLYRAASRFCRGLLGKGNRQPMPKCVHAMIHEEFPASDGVYTGYKDTK